VHPVFLKIMGLAPLLLLLSLIHPKLVPWFGKKRTRKRVCTTYFVTAVLCAMVISNFESIPTQPCQTNAIKGSFTQERPIAQLEAEALAIPASNAVGNLRAYKKLLTLDPENKKYQRKVTHYSKSVQAAKQTMLESRSITAGARYSIISESKTRNSKRSLDVRLDSPTTKAELRSIANELRGADPRNYDRTFICYYLPAMEVQAGAWATTHFNPDLKICILGLTKEQTTSATNEPVNTSRKLAGTWFDQRPHVSGKITIYRKNGRLFLTRKFKDGSSYNTELIENSSSRGLRLDKKESNHGDYYIINKKGDLEMRDSDGLISTAKKMN